MHMKSLQRYFAFVCVFMASVFVYGSLTERYITSPGWKFISAILNIVVLVFNTYFLFLEGVQMFNADESTIEQYSRMAIQANEVR